MFLDLMLALREGGLKVSLNEWLSLMEAMRRGLHGSTVRGFFVLCRTMIIKRETDLEKFEIIFWTFFKDVTDHELAAELDSLLESDDQIREVIAQRRQWEDAPPIGGCDMDLTGSTNPNSKGKVGMGIGPGNGAGNEGSGGRSTVHAPGDRKFRDWRTDSTIESRQFQMAFRLLRELSRKLNTQEEELDIWGTIDHTCRRGGILDIRMQPPRRNKLKVMVLIDSGGSMQAFEQLCSLLFQSLHKANTFTDLKIFYFHNCLEGVVYKDPVIDSQDTVKTEWILKNISSDYRVIFVGDAEMAYHELVGSSTSSRWNKSHDGLTWFKMFKEKYPHSVWLHPQEREENINWMSESFIEIEKVFPMYRLSIEGLKEAMYKLMRDR